MKTAIKSIIALTITAITLTSATANATTVKEAQATTTLTSINKVSKIAVSGNVELILVQSAEESVKVYNNYYANNALVQEKDGELRISSFQKEKLTVVAYVTNLSAITATDNASVRTHGKFNTLSLDVILKDEAIANLNTNTISLNAELTGQSKLALTGSTAEYNAVMASLASVNMLAYTADYTNIKSKNNKIAYVKALATMPTTEEIYTL